MIISSVIEMVDGRVADTSDLQEKTGSESGRQETTRIRIRPDIIYVDLKLILYYG